jgi:hypothetical protein
MTVSILTPSVSVALLVLIFLCHKMIVVLFVWDGEVAAAND